MKLFKAKHTYTNFEDDIEDRVSGRLFYRFVLALFIFYIIIVVGSEAFYAQYSYVSISGPSMQNTLNPDISKSAQGLMQDGVYIRKTKDVDYGDIIILKFKPEDSVGHGSMIKRALGFGGDRVSIVKMYIEDVGVQYRLLRIKNNSSKVEVLSEKYVKSHQEWAREEEEFLYNGVYYEKGFFDRFNLISSSLSPVYVGQIGMNIMFYQIPEGQVFFLGDNRANSNDARYFGTYPVSNIEGKVVTIVRNGYEGDGNRWWWVYRLIGFVKVCWSDILRFFGANS